jgi:5-bromo-4-chloroindolyl phosphate hydrolysis protein
MSDKRPEIRITCKTKKDLDLLEEIQQFKDRNNLPTDAAAARYLIKAGLTGLQIRYLAENLNHRRKP